MATRNAHHTGSSSGSLPQTTSFLWPAGRLASRVATRWHRWRTQRMLEDLPFDIRKDIGWPTSDEGDLHQQKH